MLSLARHGFGAPKLSVAGKVPSVLFFLPYLVLGAWRLLHVLKLNLVVLFYQNTVCQILVPAQKVQEGYVM